jgi:hypothetical protein
VTDDRAPDPSLERDLERDVDPDGERPVDDVDTSLPERVHDADPEAPEADALEQSLEVPLDDDDR